MKKLNVVISTLNSQYIHSSLAPFCLLSSIKKYSDENIFASVACGTVNEDLENILDRILSENPNIIGFSCYIWNIAHTIQLIKLIKKRNSEIIIILGGPEVSYNADDLLLKHDFVDYIISGEGEKPFALLLNSILNGEDIPENLGICYKRDGKIVLSEPYTTNEEPPSPYSLEYLNSLNGRIAYLETSRGCPYSCAFCLSGRCGSVRFFDLDRVKNEMILLSKSDTKTIKLVDRTFNANRDRAYEIFKFIIDNREDFKDVCFHFEIAGDILDDRTISLLKTAPAGAIQFEIGLQSFNEKTLEAINRKTNTKILKQNIKKLLEGENIHTHIDLIAGLPFEDFDSIKESFNTAFNLRPHMLQFGFLKILHGSPMGEDREKYPCTFSKEPPYEVISTPWLSKEEMILLHKFENALDKIYNSKRFGRTMDYLLNFYSPFDLFYEFGLESYGKKLSLDEYTNLLYEFFSKKPKIDPKILRDKMICDRLATNSSGIIPKSLQIRDKNYKRIKEKVPMQKGVRHSFAILYSEGAVVYADYSEKNPITGEFPLNKLNI